MAQRTAPGPVSEADRIGPLVMVGRQAMVARLVTTGPLVMIGRPAIVARLAMIGPPVLAGRVVMTGQRAIAAQLAMTVR